MRSHRPEVAHRPVLIYPSGMGRWVGHLVAVAACAMTGLLASGGAAQGAALVPVTDQTGPANESPMQVTAPQNDPRVFVVRRGGIVHVVRDGVLLPTVFMSVPEVDVNVSGNDERGLQSIAFAPDYATSGLVYAFAVDRAMLRIIEYRAEPGAGVARFSRVILSEPAPARNHFGGQLVFGPDGMLYATIGDNGTPARAQDEDSRFGKVLRLDPRGPTLIPADNPFGNEVWALGFRNPYRASFTPSGQLIIGDVGDSGPNTFEEINVGAKGANFGWPTCEGPCATEGLVNPIHAYPNPAEGCAVIGGLVVRDPDLTALAGRYLFGDFCRSAPRSIDLGAPATARPESDLETSRIVGFGEDGFACTYVVSNNRVHRVAPTAAAGKACPRAVGQPIPGIPTRETPDPIRPSGPGAGLPPAPTPPPTGAGPVTPSPAIPAATTPSRLTVVSTSLRLDSRGRIAVKVRCAGTQRCSGRLSVTSAARVRRPGSRQARTITLAGATLTRVPVGTRTVRLTLSRANRTLIAARSGKRLRVRVRVVTSRTDQGSPLVSSRVLTLRAPAR